MRGTSWASLALALLACSGADETVDSCDNPVGSVSGNVLGAVGGVEHAELTVTMGDDVIVSRTQSSGEFAIELPPGQYRLQANAEGCGTDAVNVEIEACISTFVDLSLPNCGP